jgi:mRNA-degrading endonuclease RelE of RelBE toxin-antitoxin system
MAVPRRIEISDTGWKRIKKIEPHTRFRILNRLKEYMGKPELLANDAKRLSDARPPVYRIRIGDYRAIGTIQGETLFVHDVLHRSEL